MADRLILHIGTPKSATTYLQGVIWTNRSLLAQRGVHLPLERPGDHHESAGDLTGVRTRRLPGREPTTWPEMVRAIEQVTGTALISEEMLASLDADGRRRVVADLAGTEVHVLITARDPVRQVPSVWQQGLKHRLHHRLEDFAAEVAEDRHAGWRSRQDVGALVEAWTELLPADQVHVVTVPQRGAPADLVWQRFAEVLGVDPTGIQAPEEPANVTLDAVQSEVLRLVNDRLDGRLAFPDPYAPTVRRELVPALAGHRGGPPVVLPDAYLPWAEDYARRTIRRIRDAGVHVVGDLEELVGVSPAAGAPPVVPDREELLDIAVATLADMCVVHADTRAELVETRRRLRRLRDGDSAVAGAKRSGPGPSRAARLLGRWGRRR